MLYLLYPLVVYGEYTESRSSGLGVALSRFSTKWNESKIIPLKCLTSNGRSALS